MREGWEIKKLGEVCDIKNGRSQKSVENPNGHYPIYGSGGIMGYADDFICEAGTTIIGRKGTINKPLYVECAFWNVDTAFGLQPKSSTNPRFLYYTCKSIDFNRYNKSTTLPSLVKSDLLKIAVSIPPVQEQEKIVAELDCLTGIIEKKKQQLKELDNLAQSIFYDMFGDISLNSKFFPVERISELGELARGVSKHRPRNAPELLGGEMPLIQTGDVANADMFIREYHSTYSALGVSQSRVWEKDTICITIAANIGNCAILPFRACFPDSVVGFIHNDKLSLIYALFVFNNLRTLLEEKARGIAQKNINLQILNELLIPVPPRDLQDLFAQKIEAIEKQKEQIKNSIREIEMLFNSRMDYWFN